MSTRKPFSSTLFEANDDVAKRMCIAWLQSNGVGAAENVDPYGVDVVAADGLYECEVKHNWQGGEFPFPTIQVLERKTKYWKAGAYLFMVSGDHSAFLLLSPETILRSELVEVRNKYMPEGELFYDVPADAAAYFAVEGL
jgi:hypothetical protein